MFLHQLPSTDREVSVEIASVQQGDQPTPYVVGDLVHGRDGTHNQQGDAIVEEVGTEHSRSKEAVEE